MVRYPKPPILSLKLGAFASGLTGSSGPPALSLPRFFAFFAFFFSSHFGHFHFAVSSAASLSASAGERPALSAFHHVSHLRHPEPAGWLEKVRSLRGDCRT
jgi:hypothetical protein